MKHRETTKQSMFVSLSVCVFVCCVIIRTPKCHTVYTLLTVWNQHNKVPSHAFLSHRVHDNAASQLPAVRRQSLRPYHYPERVAVSLHVIGGIFAASPSPLVSPSASPTPPSSLPHLSLCRPLSTLTAPLARRLARLMGVVTLNTQTKPTAHTHIRQLKRFTGKVGE